jgi:hypothetical protein
MCRGSSQTVAGMERLRAIRGPRLHRPAPPDYAIAPSGLRVLLRVNLGDEEGAALAEVVEQLMGNKPEERFRFISERAEFVDEDELDV